MTHGELAQKLKAIAAQHPELYVLIIVVDGTGKSAQASNIPQAGIRALAQDILNNNQGRN